MKAKKVSPKSVHIRPKEREPEESQPRPGTAKSTFLQLQGGGYFMVFPPPQKPLQCADFPPTPRGDAIPQPP